MPGLHNSNICWGNRKSFNAFPDIFGESFPAMETPSSYISTNSYYGYERITPESPPKDESDEVEVMDTSDEINKTRKRQGGECVPENSKRIRQGDGKIKANDDTDDALFLEHYLKQTHGCDYYNFQEEYV